MTRSPPSLETNDISTIMMGWVLMILQPTISPPTGVMALSISAAVVPGAKFCAMTLKGPARPRIVMLGADDLTMLTCCGASPDVSMRSTAAESLVARRFALLAAAPPGAEMREPKDRSLPLLTLWCRSCVHSPLTLPAGGGLLLARMPMEELRCWEGKRQNLFRKTVCLRRRGDGWDGSHLLDADAAGEGWAGGGL